MISKALHISLFNLFQLGIVVLGIWLILLGFYLAKTQHYFLAFDHLQSTPRYEAIVVLTGGSERIHAGLELLRQNYASILFISGVHKKVYLSQIPVHDMQCCVELGYEATNTKQNADETKAWLKKKNIKTVLLVTSDYHMPRALDVFDRLLPKDIKITPYAVPFLQSKKFTILQSLELSRLVLNEYHKFLLQRITGIMEKSSH